MKYFSIIGLIRAAKSGFSSCVFRKRVNNMLSGVEAPAVNVLL
jgi:hypothetical protein